MVLLSRLRVAWSGAFVFGSVLLLVQLLTMPGARADSCTVQPDQFEDQFQGDWATEELKIGGDTDNEMRIRAGRVLYENDIYEFTGGVEVNRGEYSLATERVQFSPATNSVKIPEKARLSFSGLSLYSDDVSLDVASNRFSVGKVRFSLVDSSYYGSAHSIDADLNARELELGRTYFTRCPGTKPIWLFRATSSTVDLEDDIVRIRNPVLRLGPVPVFYLPYISFPASGKPTSGFLAPDINYSERAGFLVNVPYYWRINDQNDMTLSPRWWTISGIQYDHQYRFLTRYINGQLNFSVLDSAAPEDARETYWGFDNRLNFAYGNHDLRFYWQSVTDREYLLRYPTGLGLGSFTRRAHGVYRYKGENTRVYLSYAHWRETFFPTAASRGRFDRVDQRPYVEVSYDVPSLPRGLSLRFDAQLRNDEMFTRPDSVDAAPDAQYVARTYRGRMWLEYSHRLAGGDLSLGTVADYMHYQEVELEEHVDGDLLHQFYWDWSWRWGRLTKNGSSNYLVRWKQLFNPARERVVSSVFGSHLENWGASTIFSLNPYVGEDYVPKQQVTALMLEGRHRFGQSYPGIGWEWRVGTRFNNAVGDDGQLPTLALQNIILATIDGELLSIDFPELAEARLVTYHGQTFDAAVLGRFDIEYARAVEAGYDEWLVHWHKSTEHNLFDIAWRKRAEFVNQIQAHTRIRMIKFWYLNLGIRYDLLNVDDSTAKVGVSYISCCMAVYLAAARDLFTDFQFSIKFDLFNPQGGKKPFDWSLPPHLQSNPSGLLVLP